MKSVRGFGFILFAFACILASCQAGQSGELKVTDAWSRPGLAGGNGALYFVVDNSTKQDDALIKAESDAAESVELHLSSMDAAGNMSMTPQEKVDIPSGQKVEFKPGGLHVMLIQLKKDLEPGQTIHVTLTFEKAKQIELDVIVQEP